MIQLQREPVEGVFPHLVNHASFIDKIVISAWGQKRSRPRFPVQVSRTRAIGGLNRLYARCLPAVHDPTGNLIQLRYGRLQRFQQVPPESMTLFAAKTPLTQIQVEQAMAGLLRNGFKCRISYLELTFDTTGWSMDYLNRHLFTRGWRFLEIEDSFRRKTLYVRGPKAPWQLRIYQKTESVVRLEFVFRLSFLQEHGIEHPSDVLELMNVDLRSLVWFRRFCSSRLKPSLEKKARRWYRSYFLDPPKAIPLREIAENLRQNYDLNPNPILRACEPEGLMSRMQANLIW